MTSADVLGASTAVVSVVETTVSVFVSTVGVTSSANAGVPTAASVIAVVAARDLILLFAIKFSIIASRIGLTVKSNLVICSITSNLSTILSYLLHYFIIFRCNIQHLISETSAIYTTYYLYTLYLQ